MKVPYKEYRKITTQQGLKDYIKEIDSGLLIYGDPKHQPGPINKEDALLISLNEKGKPKKLKFAYYITPEGDKYRLNEKNEKINVSENKVSLYKISFEDGTSKNIRPHHHQLWSYYPHLDWRPFCENLSKKGGSAASTVDHIKQDKNDKRCHYKFLEAVPHTENAKRNRLFNDKETTLKQVKSRGKSFIMTIDGKDKEGFNSCGDAVKYLSEKHNIDVWGSNISSCLIGKQKTVYNGRLTFEYTEEYLNSQNDLPNEIWKTLEQCCQKEAIENKYKTIKNRDPPKAISNMGRIKNGKGKKSYGCERPDNTSIYNSVRVHILVWLAFSETEIGDKLLLHNYHHPSNIKDENGSVIRYSNWFETLRLGTQKENMNDMSKDIQIKKVKSFAVGY
tara:strand:- start:6630 stop:7802 length:1173 start_codon:yes stop_codon:yes gene_type:complete